MELIRTNKNDSLDSSRSFTSTHPMWHLESIEAVIINIFSFFRLLSERLTVAKNLIKKKVRAVKKEKGGKEQSDEQNTKKKTVDEEEEREEDEEEDVNDEECLKSPSTRETGKKKYVKILCMFFLNRILFPDSHLFWKIIHSLAQRFLIPVLQNKYRLLPQLVYRLMLQIFHCYLWRQD
jgi:hypothetical protein